jgi:hypothetical protein
MSLFRTYQVQCDGVGLALRLNRSVAPGHFDFSFGKPTSTKARTAAKQQGWVRQSRQMPIFRNEPAGETGTIKYDLCPACASHLPL